MIERLTADELMGIAQRADAATPGPWLVVNYETHPEEAGENWDITDWTITTDCVPVSAVSDPAADYAFIAHAREDIPRLIATIAALQAAGAGAWEVLDWLMTETFPVDEQHQAVCIGLGGWRRLQQALADQKAAWQAVAGTGEAG